jgi:hypothetical protein
MRPPKVSFFNGAILFAPAAPVAPVQVGQAASPVDGSAGSKKPPAPKEVSIFCWFRGPALIKLGLLGRPTGRKPGFLKEISSESPLRNPGLEHRPSSQLSSLS